MAVEMLRGPDHMATRTQLADLFGSPVDACATSVGDSVIHVVSQAKSEPERARRAEICRPRLLGEASCVGSKADLRA